LLKIAPDPRVSLANFAQDFMEQAFLRANGTLLAGQVGLEYRVVLGETTFSGPDAYDVWSDVLEFLMEQPELKPLERATLDEAGATIEADEAEKDEILINALVEGGMSPLGLATDALRREREATVIKAYDTLAEEHDVKTMPWDQMYQELSRLSGIDDLAPLDLAGLLQRERPQ